MLLKAARIKNFRCLRDVSMNFGRQTVLVGENGAGKSTVLRAIELFYAKSLSHIKDADFFDSTAPIEIELTFQAFTDEEQQLFSSRIDNDSMTVVRIIEPGGGRANGNYYGMANIHEPFHEIRSAQGAEKRGKLNAIAGNGMYHDLPRAARVAEVDDLLAAWESENPDACVRGQDDGRFFGFSNVARGQLQKATSFVLVPAVRDAATDAQDSKNTAVGQLMELIVRSAIQQRQDIKTFEAEALEEFKRLTSSDNLPELGQMEQSLSDTLKQMYADSSVSLNWRSQDGFSLPLPMADVNLLDDGLAVPVDYAGHGLQRAFIIALLQHLAHASFISSKEQLDEAEAANENPAETRQQDAGQLPGLILAIEEPELYQHPTKQRHFARVLHELSQGHLPGMATRTQMILATHSPHFAAIDRSDDVRILRRSRTHAGQPRETTCSIVDLQSIVAQLEKAQGKPDGSFTVQSLKPRLHIIGSELAEGFFAKAIVLVEGPGDRAALMAAAQLSGRQFEKEGIAVLPVGSKNNLDRPWAIFSSLDIPTYVLWDCDIEKEKKDKKGNIKASNVYLQKLMGLPEPHEDYPNFNKSNCACFVNNIETLIRQEIGNEILNEILEEKVNTYELRGQDEALKNPEVLSQILANADEKGARSNTLAEIIDHIFALLDKEDREAVQRAA